MTRTWCVLLVLALVSTACGGYDEPEPASQPADRPSAAPTTPPSESPLPCVPGAEPFTGAAADRFGAEQVMAAYCLLADLVEEQTTTSLALRVPEQRAQDLLAIAAVLAPTVRQRWPELVRGRAAGDPAATERVNGLTLHDVGRMPPGHVEPDDGPWVYGTQVGPATAGLARGGDALRLDLTVDTGIVLEEVGDDTGRHSLLPVTRRGSYVLVPDGDRWLVADWDVDFRHGPVRLVGG